MPNCRDCNAPIKFASYRGSTIPVDAESNCEEGGVVLYHDRSVLCARPARLPDDYARPRHTIHLDTCKSRRYRKAPR